MKENPLREYSDFTVSELGLGVKKLQFKPRDSKKGRHFMPVFNSRYPVLEDFPEVPFVYISEFFEPNNASGNHYHNIKKEILVPLAGNYEMLFIDIKSKVKLALEIDSKECVGIYVPTGISHKIISKAQTGVLLVLASEESSMDDEIEFTV